MSRKGDTWNESTTYRDSYTLRKVRQVTTVGCYNETPTYHTNTAWTADGETFCFHSGRNGFSAVFRCDVATGDITQLTDWAPGMAVGRVVGAAGGRGEGIHGGVCVAPRKRWVTFTRGKSLCAVHLDTLEERTLIADYGDFPIGMPSVDANEEYIVYPRNIVPEPMRGQERLTVPRVAEFYSAPGGSLMRLCRLPLEGGKEEVLYEEAMCRGNHVQCSPTDPDLLQTDRDYPPRFWFGSDGKTNRVWTYRISTGELTEMPSPSGKTFQVHSTWTWDGQAVLYHCPGPDGYHIGLDDLQGHNIREWNSPAWKHYGHVSAMYGRPAFILDGNLSDDLLLWLYYDGEDPRVEVIARHGTNWGGHEGQYPHPHPQSSPTGRYITYNRAEKGRSDVFVVEV